MSIFSERIRECRQAKGLTQTQISEFFKIVDRAWRSYELGTRTPTFEGLVQIADFFNVSIDWLVGRTDNPKINR